MNKDSKIYLAGHTGLVGSAIYRKLKNEGYTNIVTRTHKELDLTNQQQTQEFFQKERPEYVFLAAARVGGIKANMSFPVEFLYENLMIQNNVIKSSYDYKVEKLVFLGSSCIYPRNCPQPMKEEYLLSGKLEPTNEGYALAKISGLKLCEYYNKEYGTNFMGVIPSNIYGPGDNFYSEESHVISALITKFHEAKTNNKPYVEVWGTGKARREFLYVDDLAEAVLFAAENLNIKDYINIGSGYDIDIKNLAQLIKEVVGYEGEIRFDATKPDGMPQKLLDISRIHSLGWKHKIDLKEGLENTYKWFLENYIIGGKENI